MLFRKASQDRETQILTGVGVAGVACLAAVLVFAVADPFGGRGADQIGVVIETPYVGQGVGSGTALILHGVEVGKVTEVTTLPHGDVRVAADLQSGPTTGLTDAMGIDFRPANYFGVTAINLEPRSGGRALTNGSLIDTTPAGDFTLQALLTRLGEISNGVLTPHLIDVIKRTTDYIDGLDPLLETMLVVSDALANVQTVSTAQLLTNTAGVSVAFPGFVNAATELGDVLHRSFDEVSPDENEHVVVPTNQLAAVNIFGAVGKLEGSHSTDLLPMTNLIKAMTDVVPGLVPEDAIADTARELRMRLERMFSGPPERRAVNVRVVLENLPGVAAPLAAQGIVP